MIQQFINAAISINKGFSDKVVTFEASTLYPGNFFIMAGTKHIKESILNLQHIDLDKVEKIFKGNFSKLYTKKFKKWLKTIQENGFSGTLRALQEGELIFIGEPVISITAPLPEVQLLESVIISILNRHVSAATSGAKAIFAAFGRKVFDIATEYNYSNEEVRALYLSGFSGTSNMNASNIYNIPIFGLDDTTNIVLNNEKPNIDKNINCIVLDCIFDEGYENIKKITDSLNRNIEIGATNLSIFEMGNLQSAPIDFFLYNRIIENIRFDFNVVFDDSENKMIENIIPGKKEVFIDMSNGVWKYLVAVDGMIKETENITSIFDKYIIDGVSVEEAANLETARIYCNANLSSYASSFNSPMIKADKSIIEICKDDYETRLELNSYGWIIGENNE